MYSKFWGGQAPHFFFKQNISKYLKSLIATAQKLPRGGGGSLDIRNHPVFLNDEEQQLYKIAKVGKLYRNKSKKLNNK